jgi:hypothetical protein
MHAYFMFMAMLKRPRINAHSELLHMVYFEPAEEKNIILI